MNLMIFECGYVMDVESDTVVKGINKLEEDGPSFAISREPGFGFPLREGMAVSLKCDVDSNPPSSPIWLKGKFPGYCSVLYKDIEKPLQVSRFDDTCSSYFLPS
ncbi:hypothetical protein RUM43_008615 [Polyplax serrata]|uniref:Ig-like domain-containing protein n=1 Tax=Polyplax serrata TaxID=468196 RepID=A0AAN8S843_POLSC